jgi:hypothetical protein
VGCLLAGKGLFTGRRACWGGCEGRAHVRGAVHGWPQAVCFETVLEVGQGPLYGRVSSGGTAKLTDLVGLPTHGVPPSVSPDPAHRPIALTSLNRAEEVRGGNAGFSVFSSVVVA